MSTSKRSYDSPSSRPSKKPRASSPQPTAKPAPKPFFSSALVADEVDFPRGGGTSLTPLEYKETREAGKKQADMEVEAERKVRKIRTTGKTLSRQKKTPQAILDKQVRDKEGIRVEGLNYKRLVPGTRILARIHSILPLHLLLSLPGQLLAHVPITSISPTLTSLLSPPSSSSSSSEEEEPDLPDLPTLFTPGSYIPLLITHQHTPLTAQAFLSQYPPTETLRLAAKIEGTVDPRKVVGEVKREDVGRNWVGWGSVVGEEDNGWRVDIGVEGVEGFLGTKEVGDRKIYPGQIINSIITDLPPTGRIAQLSLSPLPIKRNITSAVTNISSLLPGALVSALITAVVPSGLNVKVCGFFDGTIDLGQLGIGGEEVDDLYKVGKKIKARIINDSLAYAPKRFGLSILPHILELGSPQSADGQNLELAIPMGTMLENVEVVRVIKEFGLVVRLEGGEGGFVHISHISDQPDLILNSKSGRYCVGTKHSARVVSHSPFDGTILLSFEQKVLDQKFMMVSEVKIGDVMKGEIRRLTDKSLFINVHGSVDGVVWPLHYADIKLKHPEKRFRVGDSVKCRVLDTLPEKNRLLLTLKKSLVDSKLDIPTAFEELKFDMITPGVVAKLMDKSMLVDLFAGLKAWVPIGEASESFTSDLSKFFFVGKPVTVRIINIDREAQRVTGSIRQAGPTWVAKMEPEIGDYVEATISQIHQEQIVVSLEPSGSTGLLSIVNEANRRGLPIDSLRAELKVGEKLADLLVLARNKDTGLFIVANKPKGNGEGSKKQGNGKMTVDNVEVGQILPAQVALKKGQDYFLQVGRNLKGRLHQSDMVDDFGKDLPALKIGDMVKCCVVKADPATNQLDLSIRPSRVLEGSTSEIVDKEVDGLEGLRSGQKIRGFVKNITGGGLFVTLGRSVDARVQIRELFDDYVKDWQPKFALQQVVSGKILSVNEKTKMVEMSLRKTPSKPETKKKVVIKKGYADLEEGQKVQVTVKKVEVYGMFLELEGTRISGLCHRSEMSDDPKADTSKALSSYRPGDRLKAKITELDAERSKISFGIKPSYFDTEDFAVAEKMEVDAEESDGEADEDEEDEDMEASGDDEHEEASGEDIDDAASLDEDEDEDEDEDDEKDDEEEVLLYDPPSKRAGPSSKPKVDGAERKAEPLTVGGGFDWSGQAPANGTHGDSDDSDSSDSDEDEDVKTAPTKSRKGKAPATYSDLTGEIATKRPESTSEFERALLGSPNSSYLWVQFMSFQLELAEVAKARDIGRRALQKIGFREEEEKMNVWIALLNLENMHGTKESLDKVFKEAIQYNDSKTVHLRMATILHQTEKFEAAEEMYSKTVKKFGASSKAWTTFAEFYFARDDAESARSLLPRAVQGLPARKHAKTIEKFANLEFRLGDAERGKTIYEGLLDKQPKHLPRWNTYVDQLTKQGDIQAVRGLIDRALNQFHKVNKVKFLFKKLLSVETRIGDEAGQERAKEKAREWVARNAAKSG